jgi:hypothetical protein
VFAVCLVSSLHTLVLGSLLLPIRFKTIFWLFCSRNCKMSYYGLDSQRIVLRFPTGATEPSVPQNVQTSSGDPVSGYRELFNPEVKQPGSSSRSHLHLMPKLRMSGAITSLPLYVHGAHRDNFNVFTLLDQEAKSLYQFCCV